MDRSVNRVGTGVYKGEATSEGRMEIHEVIQDGGAQLTGMEIYSDRLPRLPEGGGRGGMQVTPLHPLLPGSIAFAFLFNRSISITIIYHLTNLLIMAPGAFTNSISLRV